MSDIKVTSISELKEYSSGNIVRLPDFSDGQPFYAKLRRSSLLSLARNGTIPNSLITTANELFANRAINAINMKDEKFMERIMDIMDIMCESVFVQPAYREIIDAGVELTDEQYLFIFSYTQQGVKALEPFRENKTN